MDFFNVNSNIINNSKSKIINTDQTKIKAKVLFANKDSLIVNYKGKVLLLENKSDIPLKPGMIINLSFEDLSEKKNNQILTKALGQIIDNLINISIKTNDTSINFDINIENIPDNKKASFIKWIGDFFTTLDKNLSSEKFTPNKNNILSTDQFKFMVKNIIEDIAKNFTKNKNINPDPIQFAKQIFKKIFNQNNTKQNSIFNNKDNNNNNSSIKNNNNKFVYNKRKNIEIKNTIQKNITKEINAKNNSKTITSRVDINSNNKISLKNKTDNNKEKINIRSKNSQNNLKNSNSKIYNNFINKDKNIKNSNLLKKDLLTYKNFSKDNLNNLLEKFLLNNNSKKSNILFLSNNTNKHSLLDSINKFILKYSSNLKIFVNKNDYNIKNLSNLNNKNVFPKQILTKKIFKPKIILKNNIIKKSIFSNNISKENLSNKLSLNKLFININKFTNEKSIEKHIQDIFDKSKIFSKNNNIFKNKNIIIINNQNQNNSEIGNKNKFKLIFNHDNIKNFESKLKSIFNNNNDKVNSQNKSNNNIFIQNTISKAISAYQNMEGMKNLNDTSYMMFNMLGIPVYLSFNKEEIVKNDNNQNTKSYGKIRLILPTDSFGVTDINIFVNEKDAFLKIKMQKNIKLFEKEIDNLKNNIENHNINLNSISIKEDSEVINIENDISVS